MGGGFVQGNQAEAQPGTINQAPAVEFDAGAATGACHLHLAWSFDALQYGLAGVAGPVVVGVLADDPAAIPVAGANGAGAAVGVVGQLLYGHPPAALDGLGSRKDQRGAHGFHGIPHAPSFYHERKRRASQCSQHSQDACNNHQLDGSKTTGMATGLRWGDSAVAHEESSAEIQAGQAAPCFTCAMRPPMVVQSRRAALSVWVLPSGNSTKSIAFAAPPLLSDSMPQRYT